MAATGIHAAAADNHIRPITLAAVAQVGRVVGAAALVRALADQCVGTAQVLAMDASKSAAAAAAAYDAAESNRPAALLRHAPPAATTSGAAAVHDARTHPPSHSAGFCSSRVGVAASRDRENCRVRSRSPRSRARAAIREELERRRLQGCRCSACRLFGVSCVDSGLEVFSGLEDLGLGVQVRRQAASPTDSAL